jgi:hypothetical protein
MTKNRFRRSVVCIALFVSTGLLAAPPHDRSRIINPPAGDRKTVENPLDRKLFWRLPTDDHASPYVLGVLIKSANQTLVREIIDIPSDAPRDAVIELLAGHPAELEQIRDREQAAPGSVQVRISKGKNVLEDAHFANIEDLNAKLQNPASRMTGTARLIDLNFRTDEPVSSGLIRPLGMEPDPQCVQQCEDTRFFCYTERCDPRGSCAYCDEYYTDCASSCPRVCVEPKSVSYYTNDQSYASTDGSLACYYPGDLYRFYQVVTYHYHYKRTTHCDNTYTDELQSTDTSSYVCWRLYAPNSCFSSQPVPSTCPF